MDPLSDVLRVVRFEAAYFYGVEASEPWSVASPPSSQIKSRILPTAEHLISYHFVTEGRAFGGLTGGEMVELNAGDVIVFPHGDSHVMSSASGMQADPENYHVPDRYPNTVLLGEGGHRTTSFVCGFFGCDLRPFNPLLASLPRQMHLRCMPTAWLGGLTRQVTEESRLGRPGADTVLTRLAELMLIELLRRYLDELPPGRTGWLAGLRDEVVGRSLALLHAHPGAPWTLAELAREVSSSRSRLAERFALLVGQPPMQYLTQWRMQVAANLLVEEDAKVAAVGGRVGYDSEAAFSRAFKQATGQAPGAWRRSRRGVRSQGH